MEMKYMKGAVSFLYTHTLVSISVSQTELVLDASTPFPNFQHPATLIVTPWAGFNKGDKPFSMAIRVMLNGGGTCIPKPPLSIPAVRAPVYVSRRFRFA